MVIKYVGYCLAAAVLLQLPAKAEVQFVDVTAVAGIAFRHQNGATGEKHLPETQGSGVAFLDYDARWVARPILCQHRRVGGPLPQSGRRAL